MRVRQLAHVCIFAHDLDETAKFWRDVLGIETRFGFVRGGARVGYYLDVGGRTHVEVFERPTAAFSETDAINHLCLEVESMDDALSHLDALGIPHKGKKLGCDDTWQSWITDPNGVKIELFEYTDKSAQFAAAGGVRSLD